MPSLQQSRDRISAGTVVSGYRIDEQIGAGGMGIVYRATQLSLNRAVALKLLTPGLAFDQESRQRFLQEGVLAARVSHPRLVRVLQVGEYEHRLFLAFELVAGGTLRETLRSEGPLSLALAVDIACACADVFVTLHAAGILHRDLKPENIFMSPDRGPLVGDLGIAKDLGQSGGPRTQKGLIIGTPAYIAPELVVGEPPSGASDLYALGIVFYECLAGRVPFFGKDSQDTLRMQLKATVPPLALTRPGLPVVYDKVVAKLLAKDPAHRYPSPEEALAALKALPVEEGSTGKVKALEQTVGVGWNTNLSAARKGQRTVATHRPTMARAKPAPPPVVSPRNFAVAVLIGAVALAAIAVFVKSRPGPATVEPPPVPIVRPKPAPTAEELAEKTEQQARAVVDGLTDACGRLHRDNARDVMAINPALILDRAFNLWRQAPVPVEKALNAFADGVRSGAAGAARRAGRLLMDLFLFVDLTKIQVWDNITDSAHARDRSVLVLGSFGLDSAVVKYLGRVSQDAAGMVGRMPAALLESQDPYWREGWLCLRALSRYELRGAALNKLDDELRRETTEVLPALDLSEKADAGELTRLSALLRAMVFMGQADHTAAMTDRLMRERPRLAAAGPLSPLEELARCELVFSRGKLALKTNILDSARLEKLKTQMQAYSALRDRLVRNWPDDPRRPPPAGLSGQALSLRPAMEKRLEELDLMVAVTARRLDVPVPPEPSR